MKTYRELVDEAKASIEEITVEQLQSRLGEVVVLDVREAAEHDQGAIPGARLLPRGLLERDIATVVPETDAAIVVYCEAGWRSALAAAAMEAMGYANVFSLAGGFTEWKQKGAQWGSPEGLTSEQRGRYSRHIRLPEVGEKGQLELLESRVLLVGAGGLGSPAALYLAAAGVGTLGIVDDDTVDASNLQRQVLHTVGRVGVPKVDSAAESILDLNPDIKVEGHRERLNAANALRIMSGYDLVVDGGDNFPTRYLINDASLHLGIPVVHGSIFRFEGQVSVFSPYEGPCYRCLHAEPPPPELAPSCAEAGVLGVLPGVVGSIQAMEAIKLILGIGEPLIGKVLVYDALEEDLLTMSVSRRPDCAACSDTESPPTLVDYDETCRPAS